MSRTLSKVKPLEQSASHVLGKENVFGPTSLKILEQKIFELSGSKVKFSTKPSREISSTALQLAKKKHEKLIYIPDTMTVTVLRGEKVEEPQPTKITIKNIFELFETHQAVGTASKALEEASEDELKNASIVLKEKRREKLKAVSEIWDGLISKFQRKIKGVDTVVINFMSLFNMIEADEESAISGGWHFIGEKINEELVDQEEFANRHGLRLPSITELLLTQLLLNTKPSKSEWKWLPTESMTSVKVETGKKGETTPGRIFVTSSPERGVGLEVLRDDIPTYKRRVTMININA
ncbi:MAG: hypothetical protein WC744_00265 [Patescibacteria group bacterium]|jgi:hypothetical protein